MRGLFFMICKVSIYFNKKVVLFQTKNCCNTTQKAFSANQDSVTLQHNFKTKIIMLYTNLKHIESAADHAKIISENENVMVICGRMGPMCIPVYGIAEELEESGDYDHVKFFDMEFDNPEAHVIRQLPEVRGFMGIPFTIYYKNGKVVKATSSIQSKTQVTAILDAEFKA
jgi:thioredoxin 1